MPNVPVSNATENTRKEIVTNEYGSHPESKRIFVVGAPRSGTSYLARALSLANDVAYFEESGAFSLYGARRFSAEFSEILRDQNVFKFNSLMLRILRGTDRLRGLDRLDNLVYRMLLHTKLQPYDLKPSRQLIEVQECRLDDQELALKNELVEKYRNIIQDRGAGVSPAKALFTAFFADFVRLSGKKHVLEKTPDHIGYVPVIRSAFPDAKIVLIRRDKKDSIASYVRHFDARSTLRNRFLSDRMLLKKQSMACRYYEQVEEWLAHQPWCHRVDYKQLIETPVEVVGHASRWAELEFDENRHRSLFVPAKASSHWGQLATTDQRLIRELLSD